MSNGKSNAIVTPQPGMGLGPTDAIFLDGQPHEGIPRNIQGCDGYKPDCGWINSTFSNRLEQLQSKVSHLEEGLNLAISSIQELCISDDEDEGDSDSEKSFRGVDFERRGSYRPSKFRKTSFGDESGSYRKEPNAPPKETGYGRPQGNWYRKATGSYTRK